MKTLKRLLIALILWLPSMAQTITTTVTTLDSIIKTGTYSYPVVTKTITITNTITLPPKHDTIYVQVQCDSVIIPPITTVYDIQSMYVVLDDWIADQNSWLAYAKLKGVNEINLYARLYLQSSSGRTKLAAFIKNAKENYGIKKVFIDYRETTELQYWTTYITLYKNTTSAVDGLLTEREPYVTGDYTGFYSFLRAGSIFAKANNVMLAVYMGQPSQTAWDSIIFYTDRVYLSWYVSMTVWSNSTNGYNYVAGRFGYMSNSAEKAGKTDVPVIAIISLERKIWGAHNDFMGLWFVSNPFFGSTWTMLKTTYTTNSTDKVKTRTELVGSCIFYNKMASQAQPR